jgi:hypothetical protein
MSTQCPALEGRQMFVIGGPFGQALHTGRIDLYRPFGAGAFLLVGTWG